MNLSCGEIVNIVAYIRSLDRWRELMSACDVLAIFRRLSSVMAFHLWRPLGLQR